MTHKDCIGLLRLLPQSGIRDEGIDRLEIYRELLREARAVLGVYAQEFDMPADLKDRIERAIR
jgi:hypothetical protein